MPFLLMMAWLVYVGSYGLFEGLMKISGKILSRSFTGLLALLLLSIPQADAANPVATTGTTSQSTASQDPTSDAVCDPKLFNRMRQKGWMEAQREVYTNQSIILKPPSVFALSCFDRQLGQFISSGNNGLLLGERNANGQTNTDRGKAVTLGTAGKIVTGLMGATGTSGNTQLSNTNVTTANEYQGSMQADQNFVCNTMEQLWTASKCQSVSGANFPTFKEMMTGTDTRDFAGSCPAGSSTKENSTWSGASNYQMDKISTSMGQPMAGLTGENGSADTISKDDICANAAYSQLESLGCEKKCYSKPGMMINGKREINCTNKGCDAKLQGDAWTCQPRS